MKTLLKILVAILAVLVVVVVATPYFISADMLKRPLIDKIEAMTGRTLTVAGDMHVTVFPVAGVTMNDVMLSNPSGYGEAPPFITLKSLDVGVALLPLLHKDIEVQKLVLVEPHINLHVNKAGVKNWQFAKTAPTAGTPKAPLAPAGQPVALPQNLRLNDVSLKNGVVTYQDETGKASWEINNLNASTALTSMGAPFSFTGSGEWNHKTISVKAAIDSLAKLSQMQAAALNASVTSDLMSLAAQGSLSLTDYRGKLNVASPSLKALMAWLHPDAKPLATPAPLAFNVSGDAQCSMQSCALANAQLKLDKIDAAGTVKAAYAHGATPDVTLDLTAGTLDFTPFLPAQENHAAVMPLLLTDAWAEPEAAVWSDAPIDVSALRTFNLTADIKTGGIIWRKLALGQTVLHAEIKNGRLSASLADTDIYNGKGNGSLVVDAAATPPALETHVALKGVDAEHLLSDMAGTNRLSGTADVKLDATSHGDSQKAIISALAGSGNFKLTGGALRGIDLANIPQALTAGLKISDNPTQKTEISDMGGSFTIAQGVVTNKDLVLNAALLHMTGQGEINLPLYRVDYRLTPQIGAKGASVPVLIEGRLDSPVFRPDVKGEVQKALQNPQQFKQELKNSRQTLKDQLKNPKDAVKNLKGLLNGL